MLHAPSLLQLATFLFKLPIHPLWFHPRRTGPIFLFDLTEKTWVYILGIPFTQIKPTYGEDGLFLKDYEEMYILEYSPIGSFEFVYRKLFYNEVCSYLLMQ